MQKKHLFVNYNNVQAAYNNTPIEIMLFFVTTVLIGIAVHAYAIEKDYIQEIVTQTVKGIKSALSVIVNLWIYSCAM